MSEAVEARRRPVRRAREKDDRDRVARDNPPGLQLALAPLVQVMRERLIQAFPLQGMRLSVPGWVEVGVGPPSFCTPDRDIVGERRDARSPDVTVLLKVPVVVEKWVRVASLKRADRHIMDQRIFTAPRYVRVLAEIPGHLE